MLSEQDRDIPFFAFYQRSDAPIQGGYLSSLASVRSLFRFSVPLGQYLSWC